MDSLYSLLFPDRKPTTHNLEYLQSLVQNPTRYRKKQIDTTQKLHDAIQENYTIFTKQPTQQNEIQEYNAQIGKVEKLQKKLLKMVNVLQTTNMDTYNTNTREIQSLKENLPAIVQLLTSKKQINVELAPNLAKQHNQNLMLEKLRIEQQTIKTLSKPNLTLAEAIQALTNYNQPDVHLKFLQFRMKTPKMATTKLNDLRTELIDLVTLYTALFPHQPRPLATFVYQRLKMIFSEPDLDLNEAAFLSDSLSKIGAEFGPLLPVADILARRCNSILNLAGTAFEDELNTRGLRGVKSEWDVLLGMRNYVIQCLNLWLEMPYGALKTKITHDVNTLRLRMRSAFSDFETRAAKNPEQQLQEKEALSVASVMFNLWEDWSTETLQQVFAS